MKLFNIVLSSLPLLFLVSCATPQATTQDKKAELCTNLARLNTSVATLKSMGPNTTVGDFKAAQNQVKTSFAAVKVSAQSVQEAKVSDLEAAENNLEKAIRKVPAKATLQQGAQAIAPQVQALEAAQKQMQSGLGCS